MTILALASLGCSGALQFAGFVPRLPRRANEAHKSPAIACDEPNELDNFTAGLNRLLINGMKGAIDALYEGRDIQRFYVLETVARVPYFSYLSCLHLYETLGMRKNMRLMRIHCEECWFCHAAREARARPSYREYQPDPSLARHSSFPAQTRRPTMTCTTCW